MHAQQPRQLFVEQLEPVTAHDQVMRRGQSRDDRRHQIQISLVRDAGERCELFFHQSRDPRCSHQLETEAVRGDARHFLEPAAGLSGNGDQTHLIKPMITYPALPSAKWIPAA